MLARLGPLPPEKGWSSNVDASTPNARDETLYFCHLFPTASDPIICEPGRRLSLCEHSGAGLKQFWPIFDSWFVRKRGRKLPVARKSKFA